MNEEQIKMITERLIKPERQAAVLAVLVGGLSIYAAERNHNIAPESLRRNVNRVKNECDYVVSLMSAPLRADIIGDVFDLADAQPIKRMVRRDGVWYGWF